MMLEPPIPGRIYVAPGKFNDFKTLERFHYRPRRPATIADVVAAWHQLPHAPPRCVGVGVLSWPTACQATRHKVLHINELSYGDKLRFANANIRSISRVVVHPTFRSLGVSSAIVRALIARCPTRYVESAAMMAHASPLFERAGMRRFEPDDPDKPVYFLFDKWLDRLPVIARDLALRNERVPLLGSQAKQCEVERRCSESSRQNPRPPGTTWPESQVVAPDIAKQIHQTQEG